MPQYGTRSHAPAAQGVEMWTRRLAGRTFRFTLVRAGWWGVGETGTLTTYYDITGRGDWYPRHTFQLDPDRLPLVASPFYR